MHAPAPRRAFLRGLIASLALGAAPQASLAGERTPRSPRVTKVTCPLPHLPPAFDGVRLLQVSDLHLEPHTKPEEIERMVRSCKALRPDAILMTGDFVTHTARPAGLLAEILASLEAPLGVYATLGNHDFWCGATKVEQSLKEKKIRVLRNETQPLRRGRATLHLAGLDSRYSAAPQLSSTLRGWKPGQPLVVLMHEPDVVDDLAAARLEALQLSGHTHGGQVRLLGLPPLPGPRRARWGRKYLSGSHRIGSMQLYVNRGIGCVAVPFRVHCPPEITEVTLRMPARV